MFTIPSPKPKYEIHRVTPMGVALTLSRRSRGLGFIKMAMMTNCSDQATIRCMDAFYRRTLSPSLTLDSGHSLARMTGCASPLRSSARPMDYSSVSDLHSPQTPISRVYTETIGYSIFAWLPYCQSIMCSVLWLFSPVCLILPSISDSLRS